jgi:GAF domain-containing protein/ActR/RegA family two-component response regulator
VKHGLGRRTPRRLLLALVGLVMLWAVAGVVVAGYVVARYDTAVTASLTSVREIVSLALDDVGHEAWLLAHDPAVVEGTSRSDWATLVRGALPRILALQQERLADLLLIVDASGFPLIRVPPAHPAIAPAVVRPAEPVTQLAFVGGRPYVLGVAPTPGGMVVVGRRFDALEAAVATLPSRPALVVVSNDRALGAKPAGAPASGWDDALRTGQIAIGGETWLARRLGEGGEGLWTLLPAREHQGPARRLWFWWAISLLAALAGAVGIAAVSNSERGGAPEGRRGGARPRPTPPAAPAAPEAANKQRSRELEVLHAVVVATGSGDDLVLTAERTLEVVCDVAEIHFGGVFRFDHATQTLALIAHRGLEPDDVERLRVRSLEQSHVGEVIRTGRATITDLTTSRVLTPEVRERVRVGGYRTQLALPIPVNGETWGVMALISKDARTFGADELTLLEAVAHQVGQVVARASLLAESREKSRRLETLGRLAQTLTATLSPDDVFQRVVDAAVELFGSSAALLWLVDDDGQHVALRAAAGVDASSEGFERVRIGEGLIGTVVATREPLAMVDALNDPRARNVEPSRAAGLISAGITPLLIGERVLGALAIGVRARHEPTPEEMQLLGSLASHAANAINNAQLYREATRQAQRMSALADLSRLLSETLDLDLVAQRVADSVRRLLGAHSSSLYRLDTESDALIAFAISGEVGVAMGLGTVFPRGHAVVGLAIDVGTPIATSNLLADPRFTFTPETRAMIERAGHRSVLGVPLRIGERVIGALGVGDRVGRQFDDDEIRLTQAFADQAALALENARLYTEMTRRRLEAEELARLARSLTESLDPRDVGARIVESVLALFQARSSVLRLLQPDGSLVTLARGGHLRNESYFGAVLPAGVGPSGRASVEGRPVASSDVFSDPTIILSADLAETMRRTGDSAVVAVPLRAKGGIIGTLSLGDVAGRLFSETEVGLLQAFGDQAALALENAQLYEQNRRQVAELSVLLELSRAVTGQLDRAALLEAIRTQAGRILDATNMAIVLRDDDRGDLEVVLRVVDGVADMRTPLRYPSRTVGLMSTVLETGQAVRTDDYMAECARRGVTPVGTFPESQHWLGVPMTTGDTVIGVLTLRSPTRAFGEADERLLSSIGHLAALSLRSARLFEERTRAYSELASAQDQLVRTEKLRALGEMASGVAHDFNNLLASILGRAQLTLQRLQDPQLRKWLQVIERSALDGAQTVRRLQEFTRTRRDQPFVAVDLNEVVRGALEITQSRWREEMRSRGVAVEAQTSFGRLPTVAGDPAELREAMTNLILNAVDAMPTGGTLTLTTGVENNLVVVTVADTGVGIPEAIRGKIFDPFFTTKGPQGTGLGLSMTYGILSRHGARITVDSREGYGTTFRLTFAPGAVPDVEEKAPSEAMPLGVSLRCLVVDDEAEVGRVLGDVLQTSGHRVVVLTDAAQAIAQLRAEPFDLVFTDLAMPRVSGWQVAQAVKEIAPTVPVVLVTGFGVELSAEERETHGVDMVLVKPLKISDVLDVVARAARRRVARS